MAVDDHRRTGHFPGRLLPRCPPFLHCDGQRLSSRFGKGALLDWHQSLGGRCLGCRRKFLTFSDCCRGLEADLFGDHRAARGEGGDAKFFS
jgi:hypothetical protein